ncbi:MBL fold metallo-hydrolase [Hymenobacter sp. 15J16-1T3B]|uniref:MBL fold metallo-hydrolase n=1 Tax=Hymenobacter sp. 15J16-1T3B TaxID=2886941 RepID=UPI001D0FA5F2|nr:MBL fold metallo-hydrolase [Hymenobacter sp. 15J16-1T3B]MCC3158342.1 MBL fold metallo-hydrolase [Hymenobacter sp. 15J16-1T3B]
MPSSRRVRNEQLPTIRPNYPGNLMVGREFANANEQLYEPAFSTVFRWKVLSKNPQAEAKKQDTWAPAVQPCAEVLRQPPEGTLIWLGHASFWLRWGGRTFLFDPVLFDLPLIKRRHPLPCAPQDLTGIDYLLLSHGHRDHLDDDSIRLLARQNPGMQVLGPLRVAGLLKRTAGALPPTQEAGWWQQFDLGPDAPVEVVYLPAAHWHRRGIGDLNTVLWGSFLLREKESGRTLYFCGDSADGPHFVQIEEQFGPLDVVLLPIGAYKPAFMMQRSHMNPNEAAKISNQLRAGHFVPMHYGTYDLSDEPASEPLRTVEQVAAEGMLNAQLHTPAVGQPLRLADME